MSTQSLRLFRDRTGIMMTSSSMELYVHTIPKAVLGGTGVILTSSFVELCVHATHKAC